eukprot:5811424-Pyramimonas_sp.AAC.1
MAFGVTAAWWSRGCPVAIPRLSRGVWWLPVTAPWMSRGPLADPDQARLGPRSLSQAGADTDPGPRMAAAPPQRPGVAK